MELMLDKLVIVDKARTRSCQRIGFLASPFAVFSQGKIVKIAPGSQEKQVLDEFKLEPSCVRR